MATSNAAAGIAPEPPKLERKPIKFSNLLLGAGLNMFEVTTLGQPLEVAKTTMAAHRGDGFAGALARIWSRGGPLGCEYLPPPFRACERTCPATTLHTPPGKKKKRKKIWC